MPKVICGLTSYAARAEVADTAGEVIGNYPAPRVIPEGKILLAEYGEIPDGQMAKVQILAEGFSERVRAQIRLVWSSPGFEPAGSCARWTNGSWAVNWDSHGARQGRRYSPTAEGEEQARAHYTKLLHEPNPYAEYDKAMADKRAKIAAEVAASPLAARRSRRAKA